ncbi:Oidioi.mRNA.OKI2018_I69.chr2.g6603.t1.cds [Oikopleura dioica]|uniref:Oidioi.mRNA.OKI2018_I69.chr2.g6603.t1.cds n=1 Tax=Oikopleura dioica TaxID=34765 RepID=A0ABN7T3L0_OIKDI|nr:Oidioi.mRNA.OKI2018_I69.chr2.g6603.t1.cds [Oikopleura dioica]
MMSIQASPRRNLPRTQSTVNKKKSFIKYAKLDWEYEGESALVASCSKAQFKCVNELIKAGGQCNNRDSNGNIPISAACNIPIIGTGTRLNEYRSGQDVDKMARSVVVVDMLINNGALLISRDPENKTPLELARIHNNWPVYLILRLYETNKFDDEMKSIATKDVFEKMKLTDLNSIRLQMIYNATTNNKAALEYLLDMFDDTEEVWFPAWYKFTRYVGEARLRNRTLSNAKRGELYEMMETLKDFKVNFPSGFLVEEAAGAGSSGTEEIISEEDAVQKIAQLRIKSTYLENLNQRQDKNLATARPRRPLARESPVPRSSLLSKSRSTDQLSKSAKTSKAAVAIKTGSSSKKRASFSKPKKSSIDPPIAENSTCLTQQSISRIVPDCCMLDSDSSEDEGFKRCRQCSRRAVAWSIFLPCGHANCQTCSSTIAKSGQCNYCGKAIETVTNILFK